jgi:hypothetical protein
VEEGVNLGSKIGELKSAGYLQWVDRNRPLEICWQEPPPGKDRQAGLPELAPCSVKANGRNRMFRFDAVTNCDRIAPLGWNFIDGDPEFKFFSSS